MVAPQPFFEERGTPIAIRLALQVLTSNDICSEIHLLTYPLGVDPLLDKITLHRPKLPLFFKWLIDNRVRPGISWRKLLLDLFLLGKAITLVWQRRKSSQFTLIHGIEEGVFIAWLLKKVFKIPYIYDMDSSLSRQLLARWWFFQPFRPLLTHLERMVIHEAALVLPMCEALANDAIEAGAKRVMVLEDISLLPENSLGEESSTLREELDITPETVLIIYVGNLQPYQGIDLLLNAWMLVTSPNAELVIVGGEEELLMKYRKLSENIPRIRFIGPRPVADLPRTLAAADILISPRCEGENTPMKIYSYLHSGKMIVATAISSHLQILTAENSLLAEVEPQSLGAAITKGIEDKALRERLGKAGKEMVEERYTYAGFAQKLQCAYHRVISEVLSPTI
jgi:glycosyltransferase involved in cell wall biosynthesis